MTSGNWRPEQCRTPGHEWRPMTAPRGGTYGDFGAGALVDPLAIHSLSIMVLLLVVQYFLPTSVDITYETSTRANRAMCIITCAVVSPISQWLGGCPPYLDMYSCKVQFTYDWAVVNWQAGTCTGRIMHEDRRRRKQIFSGQSDPD